MFVPMKTLALVLTVGLVTGGCMAPIASPPVIPEPMGSCGADGLQTLVGQPVSVLETMRFGQEMRLIRPGMAVTMDYSSDRLNITTDDQDIIDRVYCG